jgi:autotransporter-associated beta strand protein
VLLGAVDGPAAGRNLTIGTSNEDTGFSGVIEDAGKGGSLTKVGTGQLVLGGANLYGGETLVGGGQLIINNNRGSGTGRGSGARLAPSTGINHASTFTIGRLLTLNGGSIYGPRLYTDNVTADQVRANGITIESGARIAFRGVGQGGVPLGTVFTVIDNTAATPISGTFSNLADGAIVTVSGNNFQADYQGGDGNDLTLTAVP